MLQPIINTNIIRPYRHAFIFPAIVIALSLSSCSDRDETARGDLKAVVALKAYSISLHDQVEALGTAQANESVAITARTSGILEEAAFADGQWIHKGELIARLDQDEEQAQLAAATAQLNEHLREIKRLETLLARKAAATRDLDERKTLAAIAASNIREIKARIADLTLTAPFDGQLGIRRVSPGALVQAGQTIVTLDATDPIKLDFTIASTLLADLKPGTQIQARADALGSQPFQGTVTAIDSRIDPVTRSMLLRAVIDNRDGKLIPGMLMRVTLLTNERRAFIVPEESITQKQMNHFITLINAEGKAELRRVVTGLRRDGFVEIREGLTAGELVIVRGMGFVKPGQPVKVSETWDTIRDSQFPDHNQAK